MTMDVIVLAAGKGTRMNSALPKVLQPLAGRPLLAHVLETARALQPAALHVVVGHGMEAVRTRFDDPDLHWVEQAEQRGTGHAVAQALPHLAGGLALILYGDVPLVRPQTLAGLQAAAGDGLSLLVAEWADPGGYGRILRNAAGQVCGIVEERDATQAQRAIREVNTGLMAVSATLLRRYLPRLQPHNAQGEYYLTDLVALAVADGVAVHAVRTEEHEEVLGVNDRLQLAQVERVLQRRQAEALLRAGVTLADPARLDVRGTLVCGRDVFIDVGCVFEGRVHLGDGVRIGAHGVLRDCELAAGVDVLPFCHLDGARVGSRCPHRPLRAAAARCRSGTADPYRQFRGDQAGHGGRGQQDQPPQLCGRCPGWARGQRGRRHHHLQLRRGEQASHRHRGRGVHRLRNRTGGARNRGRGSDLGRGNHAAQGRACRPAYAGRRTPAHASPLAAAATEAQAWMSRLPAAVKPGVG